LTKRVSASQKTLQGKWARSKKWILSSEGTKEQARHEASSEYVGSISRLAAFGGYEHYEGDLAIGADAERLRRVKPVPMPDLPPTHGSDPLEDEEPENEIGENTVEKLADAR
jgi:hypothetical protein